MNHIDKIANLITEDPDIVGEGWDEIGIEDPNIDGHEDPNYDELLNNNPPGMSHLLTFSPKNFNSKEEALKYAWESLGVDLSDGRQHEFKINGPAGTAVILVHLEWNEEY